MSLEKEYQLEFFKKNGFQRKICPTCNYPFWTQDSTRAMCGDPPCVEYSFIGAPLTKREYSLREMREKFLTFLEERGHSRVKRYPVVARWRDDIYLTIASIADFQPHVTSGLVPPPANPLCISQPCIRLNDLDSVGKSGRHLTTFEMMAHHVFNTPQKTYYFKDRTVELCHEFLTKALGIDGKIVTYKENPWSGGGNAGPAVEVLVAGLEVATLVFMKWVRDDQGPIDVKGEKYREMELQIVDTGYGLERLVWASNGRATIYDALFPEVVKFITSAAGLEEKLRDPRLKDILSETARLAALMSVDTGTKVLELRRRVHERLVQKGMKIEFEELLAILEPLERVYAIADHSRCIAFMLGDGIVPSNVKAGYLTRLVIRRALRFADELNLTVSLEDVVDKQLELMAGDFPSVKANRDGIMTILGLEVDRYRETLEKGRRLVEREIKGQKTLTAERLIDLYDSHGMAPDIVRAIAADAGVAVDVPDDFYSRVANKHSTGKAGEEAYDSAAQAAGKIRDLPPTRLLYYEAAPTKDFEAVVLHAKDGEVVLDQTAFYPEGGGQPADGGVIISNDQSLKVVDVQKYAVASGYVVVHKIEGGKVKTGEVVHGRVDWGKRMAHTRHHTATHIILGATRRVLGSHVWQGGAQKGYERSRVDVAHFRRITDEELREIEQLANMVVLENLPVEKIWIPRDEAERKYGMQLYQGGIPEGRDVRVVRVVDFDVECCGGTHVSTTNQVGPIKILKAERIQDGLERIEFSAGLAAVRQVQKKEELLREAAEKLSVTPEELPKTVERFFNEWKELRKQVEELQVYAAQARKAKLLAAAETVKGVKLVLDRSDLPMEQLLKLAGEITRESGVVAILGSSKDGAKIVVARSPDVAAVKAGDAVREASKVVGGGGGGKPDVAQGGGPDATKLDDALKAARDVVTKALGA